MIYVPSGDVTDAIDALAIMSDNYQASVRFVRLISRTLSFADVQISRFMHYGGS
jgi:hypothetical protein